MGISLGVKIWGDINPLLTAVAKAEKDLKKFARNTEKIGKELTMGLSMPIAAFGVLAVKNFAESENAVASLTAAIRANGKDIDTTIKSYSEFAGKMQELTTIEDDAVIGFLQLAESMQAPDAKKATQDAIGLSKAFGVDMTAAIKMAVQAQNGQFTMLGKLNPAIKAAKTESEKAAIAHKMFADSFTVATAQAKVGLGPLEQLKNQIGNLTESYGKIIASALMPFAEVLKNVATWLDSLSETQRKWVVGVALAAAAIGPLFLAFGKIASIASIVVGSFGSIISAVKGVSVFLAANPWLLLAAAITAVALAAYSHATKLSVVEKGQKALNDVNREALKNSSEQRQSAIQLFEAAKNENLSKEQRIKAVKELNELSPKYLKGLTLEGINTDIARMAVERYTNSLLAKAKVEIATSKLAELAILKEATLKGLNEDVSPDAWQTIVNAISSVGNGASFAGNQAMSAGKNIKDAMAGIAAQESVYNKVIQENAGLVDNSVKSQNAAITGTETQKGVVAQLTDAIGKLEIQLQNEIATNNLNAQSTANLIARKKGYVEYLKQEAALLQNINTLTMKTPIGGVQVTTGFSGAPTTMQPVDNGAFPSEIGGAVDVVGELDAVGEALDRISSNNLGAFFESFKNVFSGIANLASQAAGGFKQGFTGAFTAVAGIASNVIGGISSIMSLGTENQMASNDALYESEKENIENSSMSQKQKAAAMEKLDKDNEKKRKVLLREQAADAKTAAIMNAAVQGALAVVTALASYGPASIAMAIIVGGLAAAQIALIASQPLPALAEGGLASAPTMAVVGDNPNARIDPEVISPLSKLKGMLSSAGEMILSVRVSGDDLLFITERANKRRSFTRGY